MISLAWVAYFDTRREFQMSNKLRIDFKVPMITASAQALLRGDRDRRQDYQRPEEGRRQRDAAGDGFRRFCRGQSRGYVTALSYAVAYGLRVYAVDQVRDLVEQLGDGRRIEQGEIVVQALLRGDREGVPVQMP